MSDFIKTKSSMCLALYHLEGLSYMLCITNKAIYNQFKGLLFMVSVFMVPSATRGASLEENSSSAGTAQRERERSKL